ncbi:DedA family protein [Wenzhouxiangella sp. XN201]|uniref:YqaA family protein n=1 Tax=Wenzhouxiangella sp. XN201 TaxID=2710755 RepID=UPI0013CBD2C4|nr:YqaA family protein [Wenzhouxiangella sp. XN201]NEZ04177.1 DedA family protein [Wenzhouxiangella sp. XN201]
MFKGLYDRVLLWSRHRHARRYLAGLSFAEATFFPVPPDVMLAPMVLADRASAWRLALLTTLTSVIGGLFGYLIGLLSIEAVLPLIERLGQLDAYRAAVAAFQDYGVWFVILAGFTPIPFKIITIAAGALGAPLIGFVVGSLIGRGARFYLVAALIWAGGERAAERLREWIDLLGWLAVAVVAIGALVWWLW